MLPTTLAITATVTVLALAFAFVCLFMMLVILVQKPKGGGLSGAFGGSGGGESAFMGAKVGDFLTWLTVGCFTLFILLAMGLTWTIHPKPAPANQPVATQTTPASPGADQAAPTPAPNAGDPPSGTGDPAEATETSHAGTPETPATP